MRASALNHKCFNLQFNNLMVVRSPLLWSVNGGGSLKAVLRHRFLLLVKWIVVTNAKKKKVIRMSEICSDK